MSVLSLRAQRYVQCGGVVVAVLAVLASVALILRPARDADYHFGTLLTDPASAHTEAGSGVQVAHLEVRWDRFEPQDDLFDTAYVSTLKSTLGAFKKAGMEVEAGITIHSPPMWLQERPEAAFVDQYGDRFSGAPNVVFSQSVRLEVQEYIDRFAQELELDSFWAIRIGVSETGEFSYPPASVEEGRKNSFWAFDTRAQGAPGTADRPPAIPPNPLPGWGPGERTAGGGTVTRADVAAWFDWYHHALAQAVNWQIGHYKALGYQGRIKILLPGTGIRPYEYEEVIDSHLDGSALPDLAGRGVGYFRSLAAIHDNHNIEIVSTSLVDGSGEPRDNGCSPSDQEHLLLDPSRSDIIHNWSSVRWIANLARYYGFAMNGESAGPQVQPYYDGVMNDAAHQMTSCGLGGLMWAFDKNLYDGTPGSSLKEYAEVIEQLT
ncbi:hypothetical protein ACF068_28885 [Streptomyces sp. NPDC016309]|uniref:hypothetical protein n=1 Tax=Streptomyces sp. NPDC016309 TaxID=3364965 RepID=UPI003701FC39